MATKKKPNAATQANGTLQAANKTEAVKAALNELGRDAPPPKIQEFVKETFGMDLEISLINNYKHTINKKAGKGKTKKVGVRKPKAELVPQAARRTSEKNEAGITLQDIQLVKDLTGRLGIEKLQSLINLVG